MALFGSLFRRRPGPQDVAPVAEVDPLTSGPHLDLLCYFLEPKAALQKLGGHWAAALGEASAVAVERLVRLELLVHVSLGAKLDRTQTVAELRAHLKARNLPASDNKAALVAKLVAADETGATALVRTFDAFDCTLAGEALARQRLDEVAGMKAAAIAESRSRIQAGDYAEALDLALGFEASHTVQRRHPDSPFAIRDTRDPVETMIAFATGRPKLFGELPEQTWEALRVAAAMDRLWGGWLVPWLPEKIERIGRFNLSPAYVLLSKFASDVEARQKAEKAGICRGTILSPGGCCANCDGTSGKTMPIGQMPELPHPNCQNIDGCRCLLIPEVGFRQ